MEHRVLFSIFATLAFLGSCREPANPDPSPVPPGPVPPEPVVVHVTSVNLPDTVNVGLAEHFQIPVQVLPENATDKSLIWYSLDESVATIDSAGVAFGLKIGVCNIVVVSVDGGISAKAKLSVTRSQVQLTPEMVSTNVPMQYVTWGFSPDAGWQSLNKSITTQQSKARLEKYGRPENMWDGDPDTEFHTNFDVCTTGGSWAIRSGTTAKYEYIQFDLGETIKRGGISFTVSRTSWFDSHGYRLEFSEDGQTYLDQEYADYHSIGLHTPVKGVAGESFVIDDTSGQAGKAFRGFRIVPIHGETSSDLAGYWGISEIKVYRNRI